MCSMNELEKWEQDAIREVIADFGAPVTCHQGPDGEVQTESGACFPLAGGDMHAVDEEDGGDGCQWIIPKTRVVTEVVCLVATRQGEVREEHGFNVQRARCACGKFQERDATVLRGPRTLGEQGRVVIADERHAADCCSRYSRASRPAVDAEHGWPVCHASTHACNWLLRPSKSAAPSNEGGSIHAGALFGSTSPRRSLSSGQITRCAVHRPDRSRRRK